MNANIKLLLEKDYYAFYKLVNLGIIDKDVAYNAIVEERNPEHIHSFGMDINTDIEKVLKLEDLLIEIGNLEYLLYFARDINNANMDKIRNIILTKNDPEYIYLFYQVAFQYDNYAYEHNENFDKLEKAICDSLNPKYIYMYTKLFLERNNMEITCYPSKYQSRIRRFEDGIIATRDLEFIKKFYELFSNNLIFKKLIDEDKIKSTIKEIEDHNYEESLIASGIDNPELRKLLGLINNWDPNSILDNKDKFTKLFQDDKGLSRKLEKNPN